MELEALRRISATLGALVGAQTNVIARANQDREVEIALQAFASAARFALEIPRA